MRIFLNITTIALLFAGISACSVYKIDVQQGNTLDQEQIDQLKTGMTTRQVLFVLGSPMLKDAFHPNRWDYPFSFKPGGGKMFKHHLTLFFEKDKLVRIDNQLMPADHIPRRQNTMEGIETFPPAGGGGGGGHSH